MHHLQDLQVASASGMPENSIHLASLNADWNT
jgi:hypothetical protein